MKKVNIFEACYIHFAAFPGAGMKGSQVHLFFLHQLTGQSYGFWFE